MRKHKQKFLFVRMSRISPHPVYVTAEGFGIDHALKRVVEFFPYTEANDWEMLEELDPEHYVGKIGTDLPPICDA